MRVFALKIKDKIDDSILESLLDLVEVDKRKRLEKFVFLQDLQRSLFADLLVRKIIIETFNISNEKIEIGVSKFGKPYCRNFNNFHFNVSHSGEWVVCAIDENPIGIDIEKVSTIDLDISKNFFSKKEHEDLLLSNDPFDYFFTLWSLKESYIKFNGKGLSHPLDCFSISFSSKRIFIESNNQILDKLYFKQYKIDDGYKMATCSLNPYRSNTVNIFSIYDVVKAFIPSKIVS